MKFRKFNEYLNEKGHIVNKPKNKEKSKVKISKQKNSLGHCGDEKLVYKPNTNPPLQKPAESPWKKGSVKEWLERTKNSSTAQFINNISETKFNVSIDYSKIKTNQDLIEAVTYLLKNNNSMVENLAYSLKRANLLNIVYNEISSINESVSAPIGVDDEIEEEDNEEEDMGDNEEMMGDEEGEGEYEDEEGQEEGGEEEDEDEEGEYEDEGEEEGEDEEGEDEEEVEYEDEDEEDEEGDIEGEMRNDNEEDDDEDEDFLKDRRW